MEWAFILSIFLVILFIVVIIVAMSYSNDAVLCEYSPNPVCFDDWTCPNVDGIGNTPAKNIRNIAEKQCNFPLILDQNKGNVDSAMQQFKTQCPFNQGIYMGWQN